MARETRLKRQKELARRMKQQEKAARRLERKKQKGGSRMPPETQDLDTVGVHPGPQLGSSQ